MISIANLNPHLTLLSEEEKKKKKKTHISHYPQAIYLLTVVGYDIAHSYYSLPKSLY